VSVPPAVAVHAGMALPDVQQTILHEYEGLVPIQSWGETSLFYNPARALQRGTYFCTLKDHDGLNDQASALSRPGVYRLSFGVAPNTYGGLFGPRPIRPRKGDVVQGPWDFKALDRLTPHPVYAWMGWLAILNPSPQSFDALRPLVSDAHRRAELTFRRRIGR